MADKGKILVVDDDRLVLATVSHGLAQAGYEVIDADNGDDAILLAREHRPDLALLDIRMEGLSGFDVAAYLRDHLHLPFMFLSAFADEDTVRQVQALGAVAYLVKPLDIGQILPAVAAALAQLPARGAAATAAAPALAVVEVITTATPAIMASAGPTTATSATTAQLPIDPVSAAVGVLMHRYSLQRSAALARLQKLAVDEQHSLSDQALRLLDAVELLARGQ